MPMHGRQSAVRCGVPPPQRPHVSDQRRLRQGPRLSAHQVQAMKIHLISDNIKKNRRLEGYLQKDSAAIVHI
jgi:hypothetical protein